MRKGDVLQRCPAPHQALALLRHGAAWADRGCCGTPGLRGVTVPTAQGTSAQCQLMMPFIQPQPNQPQGFSFYRLREPGYCLGRGRQRDVAPPAPQAKPYQLPYWGEVALNTFFWHVASPKSSSASSGALPFIALVLRRRLALPTIFYLGRPLG